MQLTAACQSLAWSPNAGRVIASSGSHEVDIPHDEHLDPEGNDRAPLQQDHISGVSPRATRRLRSRLRPCCVWPPWSGWDGCQQDQNSRRRPRHARYGTASAAASATMRPWRSRRSFGCGPAHAA